MTKVFIITLFSVYRNIPYYKLSRDVEITAHTQTSLSALPAKIKETLDFKDEPTSEGLRKQPRVNYH